MKPSSILLVDDDASFRKVMANELVRLGYDVSSAGSGEDGVWNMVIGTSPVTWTPTTNALQAIDHANALVVDTFVDSLTPTKVYAATDGSGLWVTPVPTTP